MNETTSRSQTARSVWERMVLCPNLSIMSKTTAVYELGSFNYLCHEIANISPSVRINPPIDFALATQKWKR